MPRVNAVQNTSEFKGLMLLKISIRVELLKTTSFENSFVRPEIQKKQRTWVEGTPSLRIDRGGCWAVDKLD